MPCSFFVPLHYRFLVSCCPLFSSYVNLILLQALLLLVNNSVHQVFATYQGSKGLQLFWTMEGFRLGIYESTGAETQLKVRHWLPDFGRR